MGKGICKIHTDGRHHQGNCKSNGIVVVIEIGGGIYLVMKKKETEE
ncbi:MAG: hypothetical protein PHE02_13295 [Lachnospiraceae bacterium]|nr:hypothetical protein [Lachnospiraceae bacterium]